MRVMDSQVSYLAALHELKRLRAMTIKSHKKTNLSSKSLNTLSNKAIPILAKSGDVVLFDRRIWHSASVNTNQYDRIVLFYGYSYRWLKPRDNIMEFKNVVYYY